MTEHFHDWRVDPSQVIIMIRDENRIRVVCADCHAVGVVHSKPSPASNPAKPKTWRAYRFKQGDTMRIEKDAMGRK